MPIVPRESSRLLCRRITPLPIGGGIGSPQLSFTQKTVMLCTCLHASSYFTAHLQIPFCLYLSRTQSSTWSHAHDLPSLPPSSSMGLVNPMGISGTGSSSCCARSAPRRPRYFFILAAVSFLVESMKR